MNKQKSIRARTLAAVVMLGALVASVVATTSSGGIANEQRRSVTTLSMWSRASASGEVQRLVDAYNKTHPATKVKLTTIPDGQFVTKFAAAAKSGSLPDIASTDLIYMPRFASAGLFTDITSRVESLPYAKSLTPGHLALGVWDGKVYGVPEAVDVSSLFYSKDLFRKAGLNPNKPPRTWAEIASYARKSMRSAAAFRVTTSRATAPAAPPSPSCL